MAVLSKVPFVARPGMNGRDQYLGPTYEIFSSFVTPRWLCSLIYADVQFVLKLLLREPTRIVK